jgi:hypothetical protein
MGDEERHRRQKDQLAGGIRGSQEANDETLARPEPTPRDVGRHISADKAGG